MEEFELLEKYAQNSPFSSNSSLLRCVENVSTSTSPHGQQLETNTIHSMQHCSTGVTRKLARIKEASPVRKTKVEDSVSVVSDVDLDDTLVAANDSTGKRTTDHIDSSFNDHEEWGSVSYDSTQKTRGGFNFSFVSSQEATPQDIIDVPAESLGKGNVEMEASGPGSRTDSVESVNSVGVGVPLLCSTPPVHQQQPHLHDSPDSKLHREGTLQPQGPGVIASNHGDDPTPVSSLMSKVFPGLKKRERESLQPIPAQMSTGT